MDIVCLPGIDGSGLTKAVASERCERIYVLSVIWHDMSS
jgi:hypothetical protein